MTIRVDPGSAGLPVTAVPSTFILIDLRPFIPVYFLPAYFLSIWG